MLIATIGDKNYGFDLKKIISFISNSKENKETEILDNYDSDNDAGEIKLVSKQIRESKSNGLTQIETLKYDMVKMLMSILLDTDITTNTDNIEEFDLGTSLAFNTLLNEGFIFEIND